MAQQQPREARVKRKEDALSLLRRDHEQAQSLYEGFQTAGGDDLYFLASRILRSLDQHARLEEELFYPVIHAKAARRGQREGEELVRAALREHQTLQKRMGKVRDILAHDEGYQAQIDDLMEEVRRHVEEEERSLFPMARALLDEQELMQLADDLHRMKQEVDSRLAA
ncbi:MAG TPA: hemerythrin domain-containing protein [Nitrospira sp.]|nr:hemerythrin domain-containing protein [Nitrospira sp.]